MLATNSNGILLLNNDFQIINRYTPLRDMDYHGIAVCGDDVYVAETSTNSIGIYTLPDLMRRGEIRFSSEDTDVHHVNDLCIDKDTMYVSMFSYEANWRHAPVDSGTIVEYSLRTHRVTKILYNGLKQPHSVTVFGNELFYCDSGRMLVKQGQRAIFQSIGWTRGLDLIDNLVFIGQSHSRNTSITSTDKLNVSLDCGVHIFDRSTRTSTFLSLPSQEVYSILAEVPNHA
ncbi:MAG: TIGR03032 family protein [Alicyclobacillus sp.]|nr:TIGR03032 family protein [Alicyclobacillus sp.]